MFSIYDLQNLVPPVVLGTVSRRKTCRSMVKRCSVGESGGGGWCLVGVSLRNNTTPALTHFQKRHTQRGGSPGISPTQQLGAQKKAPASLPSSSCYLTLDLLLHSLLSASGLFSSNFSTRPSAHSSLLFEVVESHEPTLIPTLTPTVPGPFHHSNQGRETCGPNH
jgi:hypothetical protein